MNIIESIALAFNSIKVYKLRAFLTLLSISIGVFAIMGAGTLITSMDSAVSTELDNLGETNFFITRMPNIHMGNEWHKYMKRKPITYTQVKDLKRDMVITKEITSYCVSMSHTVNSGGLSTDPDVNLIGTDENYFKMFNVNVVRGRILSAEDVSLSRNVAVIGNDILVKVFPHVNPLGQKIRIKNQTFTVVGVLEQKGAVLGKTQDNQVIMPITFFLRYYTNEWDASLNLAVKAPSKAAFLPTMDEAIGLLRSIRNVKPWEENSFEIETNESISQQFGTFTSFLSYFGFGSGFIALIAAGVGIMNIMLVSVKERTREIGVRKAVGARRSWILVQFIVETITLCQIGGFIGIGVGLGGAWFLGYWLKINIVFPLTWFIVSIVICTLLGVFFGAYPAWKAAKLDPIEALRYE
jgi:putative ABC transport system permease protein